ncbi:hypothetical protein F5X97DRAFT_307647 [Nemania serpens]|nr:hypothetical protein F5X97DRAFT_307647 [Nemania serpens]
MGILYKLLGMRPEDNIISPSTSLIELGIDSLVAVDMRFWFTRELDLDLPVLKLLGGATVEEMVEDVVDRLSPKLIPNVKSQSAEGGSVSASAAGTDTANGKTESPEDVPESASDTDPATGDSSDAERDKKSSSNDNTESIMVSASESGETEATES